MDTYFTSETYSFDKFASEYITTENITVPDEIKGNTIFHYACKHGKLDEVKYLL